MKKSNKVILVALGLASLAGCDEQQDVKQPVYANKLECDADWGKDSENCKPRANGGYTGPHYYWNHAGGHPVIVNPSTGAMMASPSSPIAARGPSAYSAHPSSGFAVSRGGFGAHAGSSSGG